MSEAAADEETKVVVDVSSSRSHNGISFHPETKKHDGMRLKNNTFMEYMRDVWRLSGKSPGQTTIAVFTKTSNLSAIVTIQKMLADLIWRCDRDPRGRALVFPRGCGHVQKLKKHGSITRQDIPYLVSHIEYLETVIGAVRTIIARKEAIQLAATKSARARVIKESATETKAE
jgi:hypothetical protein